MADQRESFALRASGAATVAVRDRWEAPYDGDITDVVAVVGTAPTGASLIFQVRIDTVAVATGTILASGTEVDVVVAAPIAFTKGQTIDLNITQVGSSVAGSDLEVSVEHITK